MAVVGIDLAGSEKRKTGFCVLNESLSARTSNLFSDDEIVRAVKATKPKVIAIDAPLALPRGKRSLSQRSGPHLRECDRALLKMGIKFFPITLGPMRKLTRRGIRLKRVLEKEGFKVIETYPGAAQDILGIPRKQRGTKALIAGLRRHGIKGLPSTASGDELDAATCALVAKLYVDGKYMAIGDEKEILMILPRHSFYFS